MDKDLDFQLAILNKIVRAARDVLANQVRITAAQTLCIKSNLDKLQQAISELDGEPMPPPELQPQFGRKGKILG